MNALLLPGNNPKHIQWIENLKIALASDFDRIETQHYRHWTQAGKDADIDYEISVAQNKAKNLMPYMIIAKSIGTVICVKGVIDGKLKPEKVILLGVPINGGLDVDSFCMWLQHIDIPIVIIQNSDDPLGSFNEVKRAFETKNKNLVFFKIPGKTHDYLDFDAISKKLF